MFINSLCQMAENVLSKNISKKKSFDDSILALNLKPFDVSGLGNFPYYWKDPVNQLFNIDTYNWISTNLKAGSTPTTQASGSTFTNLYIDVFSKINYSLSSINIAQLTDASNNIIMQQQNLLNIWKNVYGNILTDTSVGTPIDYVINIIVTTWASRPITFLRLKNSNNLITDLNQVPVSGMPVLPILRNYIDALNKSISLINTSSSNSGYLSAALAAVQTPNLANGGVKLNDGSVQPAYVITTPLQEILNGLKDISKTSTIKITIDRINDHEINIKIPDQPAFSIQLDDFLKISVDYDSSFFLKMLKKSTAPIKLDFNFSGITMVYFQPVAFDKSTNENWFWEQPVIEAIKNKNTDITGFKFSPEATIDFSEEGPYGFLTGVAISNFPTVNLEVQSLDYMDLASSIDSSDAVGLELLGCAIENESRESNLIKSIDTDSSTNSVQVSLKPKPVTTPSINSRAWVHGIQKAYPAAIR